MSYTAEGMVALVDQYRADLFSRPQTVINDAARTYDEIRAYAAALASQPNTPPGFVLSDADAHAIHSMPYVRSCLLEYRDRPVDETAAAVVKAVAVQVLSLAAAPSQAPEGKQP